MKTTKDSVEFKFLKWSIQACGIFSLLFWIFAESALKEKSAAISAFAFALTLITGTQLAYLSRLEKRLSE